MTLFKIVLGLQLLASLSGRVYAAQEQFHVTSDAERSRFVNSPVDSDFYEFKWPIRRVAIIGAGVSGLLAYREMVSAGFEHIRIFDRDDMPGGNWHYTDEIPVDAPIPNKEPKLADYEPSLPPPGSTMPCEVWYADHNDTLSSAERSRQHRAPQAVWKSLTTNTPSHLMQVNGHLWPPETPWRLTQTHVVRYLRSVASYLGINSNDEEGPASYNTRVELVQKRVDANGTEHGWTLTLKKFIRLGQHSSKEQWWTEDFDAVVIGTGTFNAPSIPDIPGLEEWSRQFPNSVSHSRQYRVPQPYANQTVLIIGGGPSAVGISMDIVPFVKQNYVSYGTRNNSIYPPIFLNLIPENAEIVPRIARFHASEANIELSNGTFLTGVDHIIFSTGFRYTFPFLPQYHNASIAADEDGPAGLPQPLVTDGTHFRSLYRDFIYIEEPTLGFMNLNLGIVPFTYGEYAAVALARVWSGTAHLPSQSVMWRDYRGRVASRGGYSKNLPFLGKYHNEYIWFFTAWMNDAAHEFGGKQVDGLRKDFFEILAMFLNSYFPRRASQTPENAVVGDNHATLSPMELFQFFTSGY